MKGCDEILVIVDGPDGSGKSWLIKDLVERLDIEELKFTPVRMYSTDEQRVVAQNVSTEIALQLADEMKNYIVDRLVLSNLVYNEAANRKDDFDYIGALKKSTNTIMITFKAEKSFLEKRRRQKNRPVSDIPMELYDKYTKQIQEIIPTLVIEAREDADYSKCLQDAITFINTEETKRRDTIDGKTPNTQVVVDTAFMRVAELVAKRSTCLRNHVGAVLVKDNMIVSTGYSGAPKSTKHCLDIGCIRAQLKIPSGERAELCRAVHAEANAIIQAAKNHITPEGATVYTTVHPCVACIKMLINAGVKEIVYKREYNDNLSKTLLNEASVVVRKI